MTSCENLVFKRKYFISVISAAEVFFFLLTAFTDVWDSGWAIIHSRLSESNPWHTQTTFLKLIHNVIVFSEIVSRWTQQTNFIRRQHSGESAPLMVNERLWLFWVKLMSCDTDWNKFSVCVEPDCEEISSYSKLLRIKACLLFSLSLGHCLSGMRPLLVNLLVRQFYLQWIRHEISRQLHHSSWKQSNDETCLFDCSSSLVTNRAAMFLWLSCIFPETQDHQIPALTSNRLLRHTLL